jgi:ABC-type branched-subunit amino acid transport system substrate-binding protein
LALKKELGTHGLTVIAHPMLSPPAADWQEAIAGLTSEKSEMVIFSGDYVAGATFVSLLRRAGLSIPFLGVPDMARPDFARLVGPAPGEVYYVTYAPEPPLTTVDGERFSRQFQATTGLWPRHTASLAYDATNLLLQALKVETERGKAPSREGVVARLQQTRTHVGVAGPVIFDETGANTAASVFVYRLEGTGYPGRLIAPR